MADEATPRWARMVEINHVSLEAGGIEIGWEQLH